MSVETWTLAGTGAEEARTGGDWNWVDEGNITASDDSDATSTQTINGFPDTCHWLKATNYGFALPSGTVDGIEARFERACNVSAVGLRGAVDDLVHLIRGGTIQTGEDNNAAAGLWETSDTNVDYGTGSDLWGGTWGISDINASDFGVAMTVFMYKSGGGVDTVLQVDAVYTQITYTEGAGGIAPHAYHNRYHNLSA